MQQTYAAFTGIAIEAAYANFVFRVVHFVVRVVTAIEAAYANFVQ